MRVAVLARSVFQAYRQRIVAFQRTRVMLRLYGALKTVGSESNKKCIADRPNLETVSSASKIWEMNILALR